MSIKRVRKICSGCGTPQYIFSKGLCRYCWGKAQLNINSKAPQPKQNRIKPKSYTNIPHRTDKRLNEEKEYRKIIARMDKQKNIHCFFCGEKMGKPEQHHHLNGRDNDHLTEEKYIVHVHSRCHSFYHDSSTVYMRWFDGYLERLADIDIDLAYRESLKKDKI